MAFNNKKSWRYKFIDIDSSYVVKESDDEAIGYIVARAPKGTTRPTYFAKGNSDAIDALMGVGSANWPDLIEAKAFNDEYPIYISAPPGSSDSYPSYLGGFYLTKKGIQKFYNVTNKNELEENSGNAFMAKVVPGKESSYDSTLSNSTIEIGGPLFTDGYVPSSGETGYGLISFKKSDSYYISFVTNPNLEIDSIDYDTMVGGLVGTSGTDTTVWGDDEGNWTFSDNVATFKNFGITTDGDALKSWIGDTNFNIIFKKATDGTYSIDSSGYKLLTELLIDGSITVSSVTYSIAFGIQNTFTFKVSIKDDVYAYWMQKGPQENATKIKISSIGYDKYLYNKLLPYAKNTSTESGKYTYTSSTKLFTAEYVIFYTLDAGGSVVNLTVGKLNTTGNYYEASSDLNTKIVSFQTALDGTKQTSLYHKFYKVSSSTTLTHLYTEEEAIEMQGEILGKSYYSAGVSLGTCVPESPTFNQITLSCSEEVYTGETTSGGEFEGSLDETGTNTYGNGNYWPSILQDDDMSFIEVRVLKKFGDNTGDLDSTGFWQHSRVLDPYNIDDDTSSALTSLTFNIEGDRYCTLVMNENLANSKLGGAWNSNYSQIISDGLTEALLGEYDDAWLFMEPTGQEEFKAALATLSTTQNLATVISPKILTPNNKNIFTDSLAQKTIVNGRVNGASNAQFAGEFEVYDSVTKKNYYRQPIGSIGKMLARIMDKKLGGAAPAWTNQNGCGGQLTDVTAISSKYQIDDDASKTLDGLGINPVVLTKGEGVMITSQKTTQDPNFLSDWSYLGHSMSFLICKREIRNNVMRPQVMKPINTYWMGIRQADTEAILAKRTSGDNPMWTTATCDIIGQNNAYTKAQRNFVIRVDIMVTPYSETVTLIMNVQAQE